MTHPHPDAEDALERATLALFEELGWSTDNAYHELYSDTGASLDDQLYLGRATRSEVHSSGVSSSFRCCSRNGNAASSAANPTLSARFSPK